MGFLEKIRKDVQKGVVDGLSVIKEKTGKLTEEGKKKYRVFEMKHRVHKLVSDLGGLVYTLSDKTDNVMADSKVKAAIEKIRKLEEHLTNLESTPEKAAGEDVTKEKAARKTVTRKKTASKPPTVKEGGAEGE